MLTPLARWAVFAIVLASMSGIAPATASRGDDEAAPGLSEGVVGGVEAAAPGEVAHIVGDSVTAQARDPLVRRSVGVSAHPGLDIRAAQLRLRLLGRTGHERVVLALGAMDVYAGLSRASMRRRITAVLRDDLHSVDCVVWLALNENPNRHAGWPASTRVFNDLLDEVAPAYGAHVQHRWRVAAGNHPRWFRFDRVHFRIPGPGPRAYSDIVRVSVRNFCGT